MKVTIEEIANGYIITYPEELEGGEQIIKTLVFEAGSKDTGEIGTMDMPKAMYRVMWDVINLFNVQGSKWDKERLTVEWREGEAFVGNADSDNAEGTWEKDDKCLLHMREEGPLNTEA